MARILIIDDEVPFRQGVARYLRGLGHVVDEAADGTEVARLIETNEPADLVVTDLNMPGMDGLEVIRSLRRSRPETPVIAMSGGGLFSKDLLLANAGYLGARVTLAKPFPLDELRKLIDDILRDQ